LKKDHNDALEKLKTDYEDKIFKIRGEYGEKICQLEERLANLSNELESFKVINLKRLLSTFTVSATNCQVVEDLFSEKNWYLIWMLC